MASHPTGGASAAIGCYSRVSRVDESEVCWVEGIKLLRCEAFDCGARNVRLIDVIYPFSVALGPSIRVDNNAGTAYERLSSMAVNAREWRPWMCVFDTIRLLVFIQWAMADFAGRAMQDLVLDFCPVTANIQE